MEISFKLYFDATIFFDIPICENVKNTALDASTTITLHISKIT